MSSRRQVPNFINRLTVIVTSIALILANLTELQVPLLSELSSTAILTSSIAIPLGTVLLTLLLAKGSTLKLTKPSSDLIVIIFSSVVALINATIAVMKHVFDQDISESLDLFRKWSTILLTGIAALLTFFRFTATTPPTAN